MNFSLVDLEALQRLAFPLLYTLAGFDVAGKAALGEAPLRAAGDVLGQGQELFYAAADAAKPDGSGVVLSAEEINDLVDEAMDIPEAIELFKAALANLAEEAE